MPFWNRSKAKSGSTKDVADNLPSMDVAEFDKWFKLPLALMGLQPGEYSLLPAAGGLIILVRGQGIVWVPSQEIDKALRRINIESLAGMVVPTAITTAIALVCYPLVPLYKLLSSAWNTKPPEKTVCVSKSMIACVEILDPMLYLGSSLKNLLKIPHKNGTEEADNDQSNGPSDMVEIAGMTIVDRFEEPDIRLVNKLIAESQIPSEQIEFEDQQREVQESVLGAFVKLKDGIGNAVSKSGRFIADSMRVVSSKKTVFRVLHEEALDAFVSALKQEGYKVLIKRDTSESSE